jgi:hypothetical protein
MNGLMVRATRFMAAYPPRGSRGLLDCVQKPAMLPAGARLNKVLIEDRG